MLKIFRNKRQKLMGQNQMGKYFRYAFGEIILVVVGILIALGINNWNEERKTEKVKVQLLESIQKEIDVNRAQIANVFDYHKKLRDTLKQIDLEALVQGKQGLSFWQGHRIFRLRSSSFQTAVQSGVIKDFDLDLSESLNNLYTKIQFYNDFGQSVNNGIYGINRSTEEGAQQMFNFVRMIMEDVYYAESELLDGFDHNLNAISKAIE